MKKLAFVLIGLIVLYLVLCLFGPSHVKVERSITIEAPADLVKSKIADLKFFHDAWSPWTEKDPDMKTTYTGDLGKPGSSMSWESDKKGVGSGTMTYLITSGDSVMFNLGFAKRGDSQVHFHVTPEANGCKVTWGMDMNIGFMMRGMMLFMNIDKMVGGDFEHGLVKLKTIMESMPATSPATAADYKIKEMSWSEKTYIGKKKLLSFDSIMPFFAENMPKLGAYIGENKIELEGYPAGLYFTYDEAKKQTECAAVYGVKNVKNVKGGWEKFTIAPSKVLMVEYFGPYEGIGAAHNAIDAHMKEKGESMLLAIEEYVTGPMQQKDPAKWQTNIYYILKK